MEANTGLVWHGNDLHAVIARSRGADAVTTLYVVLAVQSTIVVAVSVAIIAVTVIAVLSVATVLSRQVAIPVGLVPRKVLALPVHEMQGRLHQWPMRARQLVHVWRRMML